MGIYDVTLIYFANLSKCKGSFWFCVKLTKQLKRDNDCYGMTINCGH